MANPLSQITFDFSSEEEKDVKITGHEMPEEQQDTMVQEETDPRLEPEDAITTVVEALEKRRSPRGRLSLKEIHLNADLIQIPPDEILFKNNIIPLARCQNGFV